MTNPKRKTLYWIGRTFIIWVAEVLGLGFMAWLLPGVQVIDPLEGAIFIAVVGVLNALLWPLLSRLTLPFMVFTFGLFALLLNAIILYLASQIVVGVTFTDLSSIILTALGITTVNMIVSSLLTIDDDASYYRNVLQRQQRRKRDKPLRSYPGVIFVEIDGLSEPDLRDAIEAGYMPNLARWLESGHHRLMPWETDTSCQTGGCQAGILHGNNADMPAFRWVEKENNNRLMTSSGPLDAPEIERRISDGQGLLSINGYSRVNMFSGDATNPMMTYSRLLEKGGIYTPFYYNFFSNPYSVTRTFLLFFNEIIREVRARRRQERENVQPRLGADKRGGIYPIKRSVVSVILPELLTNTLIGDIFLGDADAVYVTFASYDELAHYSGVTDPETLHLLSRLDQAIGRFERAAQEADRQYEFVILSDHGMSRGATFKQRYGLTLDDLVRDLLPAEFPIHSRLEANEGWDRLNATLTETSQNDQSLIGRAVRRLTQRYENNGQVVLGPEHDRVEDEEEGKAVAVDDAQLFVLASGNLGLLYFADWPERMSYEQINEVFPNLVPGLLDHEGIGFIMVDSEDNGGIVMGKNGRYFLEDDQIEGQNPLANFRPRAAQHLRRTHHFKYVPDILVNSFCDPETKEAAAFEEQIGFHGGFGGSQACPFLFFPAKWELDKEEIVGAEHVYQLLKQQLDKLRTE